MLAIARNIQNIKEYLVTFWRRVRVSFGYGERDGKMYFKIQFVRNESNSVVCHLSVGIKNCTVFLTQLEQTIVQALVLRKYFVRFVPNTLHVAMFWHFKSS